MRQLAIALVLFLATILPGFAQSQRQPNTPATQKLEPNLNKDYWTEERRRNAKPLDLPRLPKEEFDRLRKEPSRDGTLPSRDFLIFGIPVQADPRQGPYSHVGHLYFTRDGEDRMCTAQFVGDPTVLLTAAHCLRNATTGAWSTNFVFYRAFDNGSSQQQVQIVCPAAFEGWVIETGLDRFKWDYGFLKTSTSSTSGHFGLTVGLPHAAWEAIGYPNNFGGNLRMQKVSGTKGAVYRNRVEMLGNPMRRGNSGGAWHVNGYAIGNESFDVEGENNTMWSPYYDDNVLTLWQFALRGCQ